MSTRLLESAKFYAQKYNWKVFPLHNIQDGKCSCGNPKCHSPGKHPRVSGGFQSASSDLKQIDEWWRRWPRANIGLATGKLSQVTVLDVDLKSGGFETLNNLKKQHGEFEEVPLSGTGGGGIHYFFQYVPNLRNSAGKLGDGLDIRGDGGYVVLPPSNHKSGGNYVWRGGRKPTEVSKKMMPMWMVRALRGTPTSEGADEQQASESVSVNKGKIPVISRSTLEFIAQGAPIGVQRDRALKAGRALIASGMPKKDIIQKIWTGLQNSEQEAGREPWTEADAAQIVNDLMSKPAPPVRETDPAVQQRLDYRQDEIEAMFAAAVYLEPEIARQQAGWLNPDLIKSENIRLFWQGVMEGRSHVQMADIHAIDVAKWKGVVRGVDVAQHAQQIADATYLRDAARTNRELAIAISAGDVDKVAGLLRQASESITPKSGYNHRSIDEATDLLLDIALDPLKKVVPTMISPLDKLMYGGMERRTLSVWAARPGVGKTTLLFQIVNNCIETGNKAVFFSGEMPTENLLGKVAAGRVGLTWKQLLSGEVARDSAKLNAFGKHLDELRDKLRETLFIYEAPLTLEGVWRAAVKHQPDLIVLDHLRLVRDSQITNRRELRQDQRLGLFTSLFKDISKETNSHFALIHQLNRGVEQRQNKVPDLPDLRDSGLVEEDADEVYMLYREDYYEQDEWQSSGRYSLTEVISRKGRYGGRNERALLEFDTRLQTFGEVKHLEIKKIDLNKTEKIETRREKGLPEYEGMYPKSPKSANQSPFAQF